MPHDFHFLNPEWFLALLPLAAILWAASRQGAGHNAWQRVVDRQLLPYLLMERGGAARWLPLALAGAGWLAAVIALANPTFERRPVPAVRPEAARVVVLDLSRSMDAADLKPTRLTRARYKVADILERSRDGQVGLVAFAGDAFVVAPLSDDADTLLGMLEALSTEVMPVRGSRPDLALTKAGEILDQAGVRGGEVILVGDDPGDERAREAAAALAQAGRSLSVIGVGTEEGAPVPGARDPEGRPALARLDPSGLAALALAGGGDYAPLSADGSDLDRVLHRQTGPAQPRAQAGQTEADQWDGLGPWIALGLLPLGALAFRRGWLLGAVLALTLTQGALTPSPALALGWDDLWQRRDQQAAAALAAGDAQRALDLAEQPGQRGTASYRLGDYQAAAAAFAGAGGADADYNRGNALALDGRLEDAIAAYDAALKREPGMADAEYNKARVEELLKQQQQQQEQQGGGQSSEDQQDKEDQKGQQDQADQEGQPDQQGKDGQQNQDGQQAQQDQAGQQGDDGQQAQQAQQGGHAQKDQQGNEGQQAQQDQQGEQAQQGQEGQQDQAGQDGQAGAREGDADTPQGAEAQAHQAQAEQAAKDYSAAAREAQARKEPAQTGDGDPTAAVEEDLTPEQREQRQAADQWLRRVPDDPSGLLRRKFLYQYRLRSMQQGATTSGNPW